MAPALASSTSQISHFSPAELSYLHTSLSYPHNPIRPDGRSATQFRPLAAESDILPNTNGSARIGFADGTQAIVGVKAEVERTVKMGVLGASQEADAGEGLDEDDLGEEDAEKGGRKKKWGAGQSSWVEMSIEIPGLRDDDALPVFLAEMMREALVGSGSSGGWNDTGMEGGLKGRLVINQGWHWRIYIDVSVLEDRPGFVFADDIQILLLSPPLSYPLPLLSLTTHLALLSTKLPKLISKDEEDPMFDDDWAAAEYLYPRVAPSPKSIVPQRQPFRPPVTLLVISVGENIIFDPSGEEIAVADAVFCVSIGRDEETSNDTQDMDSSNLRLLAIRTIDPPSRLTNSGLSNSENALSIGLGEEVSGQLASGDSTQGVWKPRLGGVKRSVISRIVKLVLQKGGVGDEVMQGLEGVDVG
ncbi:Exosome complex component rrp42 [Ophidiomyces ophidiicola]|uniref:Exosome complex component rrp42 n=1 Tax=Ophidiomyces ophidiicola TaxID=1387563 RepID=A0ACB8UNQ4_9EURO|nr:Exosome complex component rrp42 [Ophidiomyces ophidiicola]KAI1906709.1 Exosome complex component rrp42 [Ophidiomyces ophidiicola]KAI1921250.1 Exosome complex component rrp42 [Ophidiomyces ophidiicola]KAI1948540.1 Exosome complex component rrp42 [Ophidiomyces ophidiicola]KAI1949407.1 Exosome complex component rrp42 [Ophidiomyces ophidiicola]KAI1954930.1 Exosome complex component rrp42 [Ophidiomyces ophidiicola]